MARNKTSATTADVDAYISSRANDEQRADCAVLMTLFERVTGHGPKMWGPSIVGFDSYKYGLANGGTGESCLAGFAIRGRELVVYLSAAGPQQETLLARLGRHRMGKACLYIKRLRDLDLAVLEQLVVESVVELRRRHGDGSSNR